MNRIQELRQTHHMKQIDLANILGVSQGTLSNWERGAHDPDNETVVRIAEQFNVTTDYLLGRTNDPASPNEKKPTQDDIILDELEFALFGEVRELGDEEKAELLRMARRMRELEEFKKQKPTTME